MDAAAERVLGPGDLAGLKVVVSAGVFQAVNDVGRIGRRHDGGQLDLQGVGVFGWRPP